MTTVLRAAQRKDRLQLYTGRVALLPQVDRFAEWLSSVAQQGEESKKEEASPFHSPARTLLARLSTCAEGKLMQRFWVVSVKGQWLLDGKAVKSSWGTLYETVKQRYADRFSAEITQAPHNDGFVLNEGGVKRRRCEAIREDAEKGLPLWWLNTLETDAGVVRLQLHRGLVIDLTYHPWEREWLLLGLHWTLLTHTSPTLIEEGSAWWVSDEEEEEGEAEENEEEESSAHFLYVVPGHQAEMRQHLQRKFAEDGLEGGCLAANQLSLCLLMDTIAQQLHQLKEHVFVGRLKGKWETEIVRGSFISFRFQPHASLFAAVRARSSGGFSGEVLHGKFFIEGGTLLFEHHWGTDLITQRIYPLLQISPSVVLSAQDEGADGATQLQTVGDAKLTGPRGAAEGVVLDADQLVWYCCQQSLL